MPASDLLSQIRDELKQTVRLLLAQLRHDRATEQLYAILFEVGVCGTYTICVAGTEESLTRLAALYASIGYSVKFGDAIGPLREFLRWAAPGDDLDGWYWGAQPEETELTLLIQKALKAKLIVEYRDRILEKLCVDALRELDLEGAFGVGYEREGILIGTCCCEVEFVETEDLVALNPTHTIARFRQELIAAAAADLALIRPKFSK